MELGSNVVRVQLQRPPRPASAPVEAIEVCERDASTGNIEILTTLGVAYLHGGARERAEAVRTQLMARQPVSSGALAKWYAAAGDHSAAFEMLDRSLAERVDTPSFKVDPFWDPLRKDARFTAILKRIGLT